MIGNQADKANKAKLPQNFAFLAALLPRMQSSPPIPNAPWFALQGRGLANLS
jgi:hypothetical protein